MFSLTAIDRRTAAMTAIALGLGVYAISKRRKHRSSSTKDEPIPKRHMEGQPPGKNAPLMHGIRVVEISTIIAAPSACRIFRDLGAEVVKIEGPGGPGSGEDPLRSALVQFSGAARVSRGVSPVFETQNLGKLSVVLDLKKDRTKLIEILKNADVLITNVRKHQLRGLRLDYDQLIAEKDLQHLIVGHISAFGRDGVDRALPGFDITAFVCATGMGHKIHGSQNYMYAAYPQAFGDVSTGLGLVAGVSAALARRWKNGGKGCLVTNSLYRAGIFAMSPHILSASAGKKSFAPTTRILEHKIQNYSQGGKEQLVGDPLNAIYSSGDTRTRYFCLAVPQKESAVAYGKLSKLLRANTNVKSSSSFEKQLRTFFLTKHLNEIKKLLDSMQVSFLVKPFPEKIPSTIECNKDCYETIENVEDMPVVPRIPFDFSCSSEHRAGERAASKGAHTKAFLSSGWSDRHIACTFRSSMQPNVGKECQEEYIIIELSEKGTSCISAGVKQFAETLRLGEVDTSSYLLEPKDYENVKFWNANHPDFAHLLFDNTTSIGEHEGVISLNDCRKWMLNLIKRKKEKENVTVKLVFATNIEETCLNNAGLDYDALRAQIPDLIMLLMTPFGKGKSENKVRGELASWFLAGGISEWCSGIRAPPPHLPSQLGELCSSFAIFASLSLAHFHRVRTKEGQFVALSFNRIAIWMQIYLLTFQMGPPGSKRWARCRGQTYMTPGFLLPDGHPGKQPIVGWEWCRAVMPTFATLETRDGQRVLLAVKSLPNFLSALKGMGCKWTVLGKTVLNVLYERLILGEKDLLAAITSGFASANEYYRAYIEPLSWKEFKKQSKKDGTFLNLAWTPILTPEAVPCSVQAAATNALTFWKKGERIPRSNFLNYENLDREEIYDRFVINCPVQLRNN
eukprot:g1493.t1